jgi:hypothetical protein
MPSTDNDSPIRLAPTSDMAEAMRENLLKDKEAPM